MWSVKGTFDFWFISRFICSLFVLTLRSGLVDSKSFRCCIMLLLFNRNPLDIPGDASAKFLITEIIFIFSSCKCTVTGPFLIYHRSNLRNMALNGHFHSKYSLLLHHCSDLPLHSQSTPSFIRSICLVIFHFRR